MAETAELEFVARLRDEASATANRVQTVMRGLGGPVQDITADIKISADGAERAGQQAESVADAIPPEFQKAGDEAGKSFGERISSGISSQGPGIAKVAGGLALAAGAALTVALTGAISTEAATDKLAAGLGLSEAESARIGKVAGDLYTDAYGSSLEEVNTAVGAVMTSIEGMATASSADLQGVTANALDFASAFDTDVTTAAQAAGLVLKNGLAKDATEAFDLLTAASQEVPTALRGDLLEASNEYGGFFSQLGFTGREAFAVLADGAEQGTYGLDKAGDAVKEFTIRSTDMSTASQAAYQAIGLDAQTMSNEILAGGERASTATSQIIDGLMGIQDPTAQATAAIALFGTPLEDLGTAKIPGFLASLSGATGELEEVDGASARLGETLAGNASTNIESFSRQVKTGFVDLIGGQVLPAVTELAGTLSGQFGPALSSIGGFLSGNMTAVVATVAAFAGLAAVVGTVLAAYRAYQAVAAAVAIVQAALVAVQNSAVLGWVRQTAAVLATAAANTAYAVASGVVRAATIAWTAVQWLLNAALSANPIGLIVLAIAALVAGVILAYQNSETFRNIVQAAWQAIQNVVGGVISWLTTAIPAAWNWITSTATSAWNGIVAVISGAWNFITGVITTALALYASIIMAVWNGITSFLSGVWSTITGAVSAAWNAVTTAISTALAVIQAVVSTVWNAIVALIASVLAAILSRIVGAWNAVSSAVSGAVNFVRSTIAAGFGVLGGIVGNAMSAVSNAVSNAVGAVRSAAANIVSNIVSTLQGAVSQVAGIGADIVNGIVNGIRNGAGRVAAAARDIVANIAGPVKRLLGISSPSKLMAEFGRNTAEGMARGIEDRTRAVAAAAGKMARAAEVAAVPNLPDLSLAAGRSGGGRGVTPSSRMTVVHRVSFDQPEVAAKLDARQVADLIARDAGARSALERGLRIPRTQRTAAAFTGSR